MLNCVRSVRWKKVSQNILYLPHFISTGVMVGMLLQMINPVTGLYAHIHSLLYGALPSDLMANPSAFAHLYVWSGIWQHMGWDSVIYLAALTAVDPELHEAACIDGASRLGRVWHVDLPGILPTVVILLIMRCGSVMSVGFEKVYLMQTDLNLRASELISTYVYKVGLTSVGTGTQFSYATAIESVQFCHQSDHSCAGRRRIPAIGRNEFVVRGGMANRIQILLATGMFYRYPTRFSYTSYAFKHAHPIIYVLANSFPSPAAVSSGVYLWPLDPSVKAIDACWKIPTFGVLNGVFYHVVGTAAINACRWCGVSMAGKISVALVFSVLFAFTMLFGGGMIPNYI